MNIQTELTRITNAKAAIKTAIEGKGVTVPDGTMLDGMAALIQGISAGAGLQGYQIVSGIYTPTEQQTASVLVYESERQVAISSSNAIQLKKRLIGLNFIIYGDSIVYPTPFAVCYAADQIIVSSRRSISGGTTSASSVTKYPFAVEKNENGIYKIRAYVGSSENYPLQVGNSYAWVILVQDGIQL